MERLYRQLLLFPDRAENLDRYAAYKVRLDHWQPLAAVFQDTFRNVFERGHASILLIHGPQGTGKTLFSRRLEKDFEEARKGRVGTFQDNLWHALVGDVRDSGVIERATAASTLHKIVAENGWLEELRTKYRKQEHKARIFICDDAHKAGFLRPWTGLSQDHYISLTTAPRTAEAVLPTVAERMVELCRSDFQSSVFVLLSVNADIIQGLHREIEKTHATLSQVIELPLPEAGTKEEIVRGNINRLNAFSYWYCLDVAGPTGKEDVYKVLHEKRGFTDSFQSVDRALKSGGAVRPGRQSNQNLITLATLGSSPQQAEAFLLAHELPLEQGFLGEHLGIWFSKNEAWASALTTGLAEDVARNAALVESEFALRWVALGIRATYLLCHPEVDASACEKLVELIRHFPSTGEPKDKTEKQMADVQELETRLASLDALTKDFEKLHDDFVKLGARRSTLYEPALKARFASYNTGFASFSRLRPDAIVAEYQPCAVSAASSSSSKAITTAIRRTGHSIEFTSFLEEGMKGLSAYLIGKVEKYAEMLEAV